MWQSAIHDLVQSRTAVDHSMQHALDIWSHSRWWNYPSSVIHLCHPLSCTCCIPIFMTMVLETGLSHLSSHWCCMGLRTDLWPSWTYLQLWSTWRLHHYRGREDMGWGSTEQNCRRYVAGSFKNSFGTGRRATSWCINYLNMSLSILQSTHALWVSISSIL